MADAETTVPIVDGDGGKPANLAVENGAGAVAAQVALRANGAFVGAANPMPAQAPPTTGVSSTAYEPSHVISAAPCLLCSVQFNATQSGWLMLLDAVSVPGNGAVVPRKTWFYDSSTQDTLDKTFNPPLSMLVGAVLVFSTTAGFTLTIAGAVGQFSAEVGP